MTMLLNGRWLCCSHMLTQWSCCIHLLWCQTRFTAAPTWPQDCALLMWPGDAQMGRTPHSGVCRPFGSIVEPTQCTALHHDVKLSTEISSLQLQVNGFYHHHCVRHVVPYQACHPFLLSLYSSQWLVGLMLMFTEAVWIMHGLEPGSLQCISLVSTSVLRHSSCLSFSWNSIAHINTATQALLWEISDNSVRPV